MPFELVDEITGIEIIAEGRRIRDLQRLVKLYGPGRWRRMKGQALTRLLSG
jgi:hypothetical protein